MKIIVPLDLSKISARAIPLAVDIARGLGDEVALVAVAGPRLRADLTPLAEAESSTIPDMIESFLRSTADELDYPSVSTSLLSGDDAADALIKYARGDSVRMVVMATHGRSGFEKWRLGSITERVVRHSEVPVLVVPTRAR